MDRLEGQGTRPSVNLNRDMLGRNAPDSIRLFEPPRTGIGTLAREIAAHHPQLGLTVAGDAWPDADLLSRSDQDVFIDRGIAGTFLSAGPHEDYHQPSDDPGALDYDKLSRVVRLVFLVTARLAGRDHPHR